MADEADLDAGHHESLGGDSGQNVRKNIALHLKTGSAKSRRGRKPGRPKKEERHLQTEIHDEVEEVQLPPMKGPPEPLHRSKTLTWDHKVNLVGRRHMDPHIHCCESCEIPILIYGRVIPCKHVFCLDCAKKAEKKCMRCGDPVQRIEQAALGTVFICTHGGAKHGVSGCRRTYLSSRDLQAHVQYRHMRDEARAGAARSQAGAPQRTEYPASQPAVSMLSPTAPQQPLAAQPLPAGQAQYGDPGHGLQQGFSAPPQGVVPQALAYSQPQQGAAMESYHTMPMVSQQALGHASVATQQAHGHGSMAAQQAHGHASMATQQVHGSLATQQPHGHASMATQQSHGHSSMATQQAHGHPSMASQQAHGHPSNLIAVPLQQHEQHTQAGFDARVPPPNLGQPPPAVNYQSPQGGGVPARGYPPVSFATNMPPQHLNAPTLQTPIGHMQRGPPAVSSHAGIPPRGVPTIATTHQGIPPRAGPLSRGGAPQRFAPNQNFSQGPWQGQGPPALGHRPRTAAGAPPRY